MTAHRDSYPALSDSDNYDRMKAVEGGFRNHRFPYIKTSDVASREVRDALRTGDVVDLVTKMKDLDVTHMGIVVKGDDGEPYLLHASSTHGRVEVTDKPLSDFMKRNRQWIGVRVFRLTTN